MVLSRLTKITGPGIRTDTNWVGNNANYTGILTAASLGGIGNLTATGIITASSFSGDGSGLIGVASTDNIITGTAATFNTYPVDINAGMTVAGVATFAGNVSIAGTLTYEDVTNIDSVGIITARDGIVVTDATESNSPTTGSVKLSGGLGVVKNIYTSGAAYIQGSAGLNVSHSTDINGDLDVDGHTNLDNVSIAGVTTTGNLSGSNANFTGELTVAEMVGHTGDTHTKLSFPANDTIAFTTGGTERARFTKDGNLFVGSNVSQFHPYDSFTNDALFMVNGNLPTINGAGQATILTKAAYDASDRRSLLSFGGNYSSAAQGSQTFLAGIGGEKENTTNGNFAGALMFYTRPHGGNETERLRINSSGHVLPGADSTYNLGSNGTRFANVYADTLYGDGSNLTGITGTTINSNADNRVITGSGTANTLNAEQYLTWDGQIFKVNAATNDNPFQLDTGSSNGAHMRFFRNGTQLHFFGCGTGISLGDSEDLSMRSYDNILFSTGNSSTERVRIDSSGRVMIGNTNASTMFGGADDLVVGNTSGAHGITIITSDSTVGRLLFSDSTSSAPAIYQGQVNYNHSTDTLDLRTYTGGSITLSTSNTERVTITSDGKLGINRTSPAERLEVGGNIAIISGSYKIDTHPLVSYASFTDISGGSYAARLGSTGTSTIRSTQIYGGGNHIATFDGVNYRLGVKTTKPQTTINAIGSISTGRNVARELGTVISQSGNYSAARAATNVINGNKNYENNEDWLAPGGQRVDAYLVIDLGTQVNCDRFVIYNQNEYNHSNREVKRFTLEGSNDNSNWTTILDDEAGCSNGHEPNPGWSFRMPAGLQDDDEGVNWRYWRFTMKTFHGSDGYGGVTELELYQTGTPSNSNELGSEVTTHSLVATDISAGTIRTCGQPSFLATASQNNVNIGSGGTFPFNTEQYDRTGSFNTSTYQFTAPVTGEYFFFYQVYRNSSTSAEVAIYVNNDAVRRNRCQPNGGDFIFQQSTIIRLTDGDVVDLRSYNGNMDNFYGSSSNQRESHFGGYLLG